MTDFDALWNYDDPAASLTQRCGAPEAKAIGLKEVGACFARRWERLHLTLQSPMAGYSKRSLVDKLGIKPGHKVLILNAPQGYDQTLGPLPDGVEQMASLRSSLDFIHFFTTSRAEFERRFPVLKEHLAKDGMLWVSWPKGMSKVKTDMNENVVREVALANGLVDVKVAAIDETWSGLKLVYRLKDR